MSSLRSPVTAASRALLEARASDLARPPFATAAEYEKIASDALVILEIRLGDERVGVPLAEIVEIYRPTALSAVPGARAPVAGVAAWRGRVLTVLDLATGRSGALTLGEAARVVVLGTGRAMFGLFADEVEVVRSLDAGDLRLPDNPSPARAGIVRGVTPDALVVLDAQALLQQYTTTNLQSETRNI